MKKMCYVIIPVTGLLWILFFYGCLILNRSPKDPFQESFFEKARLIMMDEEIKTYQAIPDKEARERFIKEFWKIRDPDPSTEENENKIEFENRIANANEWFGNWNTFVGRSWGRGKQMDRGWRTARGRIYIILGPPDYVNYDMGWGPMRTFNTNNSSFESWYYRRYDLIVNFYRRVPESQTIDRSPFIDMGMPYISQWDYELSLNTHLLYVIEEAKIGMIHPDYQDKFTKESRLEGEYIQGIIYVRIPLDRVLFKEKEGYLCSFLNIKIDIYRNDEKIDTIEVDKEFSYSEAEALDLSEIEVEIPYVVSDWGNYIFYLIVTDINSMNQTKYRAVIKNDF